MSQMLTGEQVSVFRLLSLRGMLKLEAAGMRTRGVALRPRIAAEFGLSARAPHSAYIAAIQLQIDAAKDARKIESDIRVSQ